MKKADLEEFKDRLLKLQARLRGDVTQLTNAALGSDRQDLGSESKSPTHMAELGSENFEQDFALSLVANEQEVLGEISDALNRIPTGTYGQCEGCLASGNSATQSAIPKERLKAIPYTRFCVECARKQER